MTAQATNTQSLPSPEDVLVAKESGRTLAAILETRGDTQCFELSTPNGEVKWVEVPVAAFRLFVEVLTQLGAGNAVQVIPIHAELTTQEAADLLNVSRPFLIQLLEKGEIPFHKTGTHRRIFYKDVTKYKDRIDTERERVLDELAAQSQELDLGYK